MPIVDGDSGAKPPGAKPVAKSSSCLTPKPPDSAPTSSSAEGLRPDKIANSTATVPAGPALPPEETGAKEPDNDADAISVPNALTPPSSTDGNSLPPRRRILPWQMTQQKDERRTKKQRASKSTANETPPTFQPIDPSSSLQDKVQQSKTSSVAVNKSSAKKNPRTNTRTKKNGTNELENEDAELWDSGAQFQTNDTLKAVRRSTRKRKTTHPTYNIDDSIMLEDEDNTMASSIQHVVQKTGPIRPKSAPAVVDISLISDDDDMADMDDMEITGAIYPRTATMSSNPNPSPITFMQKSSLSLVRPRASPYENPA